MRAAADRGLELICITTTPPAWSVTTHKDYFLNFRVIDREIYGVRVMMGAELNVMDFDGTVDLSPKLLNNLDMAIASQHIWCMPQGGGPGGEYSGHGPRHGQLPQDLYPGTPGRRPLSPGLSGAGAGRRGARRASGGQQHLPLPRLFPGKLHRQRDGDAEALPAGGVPVVVGSDAHFVSAVGGHQYAQALLDELDFPEELVLNREPAAFLAHLERRLSRT